MHSSSSPVAAAVVVVAKGVVRDEERGGRLARSPPYLIQMKLVFFFVFRLILLFIYSSLSHFFLFILCEFFTLRRASYFVYVHACCAPAVRSILPRPRRFKLGSSSLLIAAMASLISDSLERNKQRTMYRCCVSATSASACALWSIAAMRNRNVNERLHLWSQSRHQKATRLLRSPAHLRNDFCVR